MLRISVQVTFSHICLYDPVLLSNWAMKMWRNTAKPPEGFGRVTRFIGKSSALPRQ
jgi:hypothetical protein